MKKVHKVFFIVFLLLSSFSAYSLAQMNQVHQIGYEWDKGMGNFSDRSRDYYGEWTSPKVTEYMDFNVITNSDEVVTVNGSTTVKYVDTPEVDFNNEFLVFATLGEVPGRGYLIKVKEIAQRGNIVEVAVDLAQPRFSVPFKKEYPYDVIKVSKDQIANKGDLTFVFKDYNGTELFRKNYVIDKKNGQINFSR